MFQVILGIITNLLSCKIHYDIKQSHVRSTAPSELDKEDLGNVQQHVGL